METLPKSKEQFSSHLKTKYQTANKEITLLNHFLTKIIPKLKRIEGVITIAINANNVVLILKVVFHFAKISSFSKLKYLGIWFDLYLLSTAFTSRIFCIF